MRIKEWTYEDDDFAISVADNPHPDKFEITIDKLEKRISVKRTDMPTGWGQDLLLKFLDKSKGSSGLARIGPSPSNVAVSAFPPQESYSISVFANSEEVSSRFSCKKKAYLAMATIPSRISQPGFFHRIEHILKNQTHPAEKVFVTLAREYKRLGGSSADPSAIERLMGYEKVDVIIDEDYGPASKLLGPLMNRREELLGNMLVVVDDDRFYSPNLIRYFCMGFDFFPGRIFASNAGDFYFEGGYLQAPETEVQFSVKERGAHLQGFVGYSMMVGEVEGLIEYHKRVLAGVPNSFWHDEGITHAYLEMKREPVVIVRHRACDKIVSEPPNALCQTTPISRSNIEQQIFKFSHENDMGVLVGANNGK